MKPGTGKTHKVNNKEIHLLRLPFVSWMIIGLLLFACTNTVWAQQKTKITGQVLSATDKSSIIGATVYIKGTTRGTASDIDGKFTVDASSGDILVVSFIGYKTSEVKIGASPNYLVLLTEDIAKLDEIVVVGYGTMKRSDLTGAMASVSEQEIKKTVATSLDQALQGRTAGVQVTQNSGTPGGSVSV